MFQIFVCDAADSFRWNITNGCCPFRGVWGFKFEQFLKRCWTGDCFVVPYFLVGSDFNPIDGERSFQHGIDSGRVKWHGLPLVLIPE
jgi:hypothetical protein